MGQRIVLGLVAWLLSTCVLGSLVFGIGLVVHVPGTVTVLLFWGVLIVGVAIGVLAYRASQRARVAAPPPPPFTPR